MVIIFIKQIRILFVFKTFMLSKKIHKDNGFKLKKFKLIKMNFSAMFSILYQINVLNVKQDIIYMIINVVKKENMENNVH